MSNLEIFVSVIGVLLGYFIVSKFLNRHNTSINSPEPKRYLPGKTMSEEEFRAAELLFNNNKEGYIVKHWRGHHSLLKSFWLNNFAINVLFLIITAYWAGFGPRTEDPVLLARVILSLTVLGYVIIYPWQFVGLWRSANFHIKDKQKKFWPRVVKFLLIISAIITLVDLTTEQQIYKDLYHHSFELTKESNYDVRLEDKTITLNGDLNYGISETVDQLISDNPYVDSIVLNSNGGLVYEGSQLSFLILSNSLNTYTTSGCNSACTIAFISGNRRYISKGSNLGFHQYSNYRKQSAIEKIALFDLQQEDANLFKKRGVSEEFIDLMYQASPDDMWYPTDDELFAYGIVHEYAK